MKKVLTELALAAVSFLILDGIWLAVIMKDHYSKIIYDIQGSALEANFIAALLCYFVLIGGLYYFVIMRIKTFDILQILYLSIPFGITVYGTYDFTTSTVLKGWDLGTAFIDVAWGSTVSSITSILVLLVSSRLFPDEFEPVHIREN
jgi:uncharacterized membrane protein